MILSDFRDRIRQRLRDTAATPRYTDAYLTDVIDEAIDEMWPTLSQKSTHFYRKESTAFTGITNAVASTNNEQYTTPTDFRARGDLRRNDLSDKPTLRYVDLQYIDDWRIKAQQFYSPDPLSPSGTSEVWSLYNSTNFIIIPAPAATSYTYILTYLRTHTTASADGNTVDIPDEAISLLIQKCTLDVLTDNDDPAAKMRFSHFQNALTRYLGQNVHKQQDVVPAVERFWA
jgi:hypothetical protein